ncbi:hypothetical protein J6590_070056 [Homalodisca vitripennis]|nr:hypothetical protein J6590_070056 [Homalodisca vitripennis]
MEACERRSKSDLTKALRATASGCLCYRNDAFGACQTSATAPVRKGTELGSIFAGYTYSFLL